MVSNWWAKPRFLRAHFRENRRENYSYLNSMCTIVIDSETCFNLGLSCISIQPFEVGAYCTMLSKKSAKICWILNWSPYTPSVLTSSGISWINCTPLSLSKNIAWLTTASITLPSRNSVLSSSNKLTKMSQIQLNQSNMFRQQQKKDRNTNLRRGFWMLTKITKIVLLRQIFSEDIKPLVIKGT